MELILNSNTNGSIAHLKLPDEPLAALDELRLGLVGDEAPEEVGARLRRRPGHAVVEPLLLVAALLGPHCAHLDLNTISHSATHQLISQRRHFTTAIAAVPVARCSAWLTFLRMTFSLYLSSFWRLVLALPVRSSTTVPKNTTTERALPDALADHEVAHLEAPPAQHAVHQRQLQQDVGVHGAAQHPRPRRQVQPRRAQAPPTVLTAARPTAPP